MRSWKNDFYQNWLIGTRSWIGAQEVGSAGRAGASSSFPKKLPSVGAAEPILYSKETAQRNSGMDTSDDWDLEMPFWARASPAFYISAVLMINFAFEHISKQISTVVSRDHAIGEFGYIGFSTAFMLAFYFCIRSTTDKSEKRCAWILTLPCAVVSSIGCIPKICSSIVTGWTSEILYSNDTLSKFLVVYFLVYLFWDSIIMMFHYRTIGGLTHHIPYAIFMSLTIYFKCPSIFVLFFPLEISTIPLAIGHIWPQRRFDLLFGMSFFYFRIIYHGQMCVTLWKKRDLCPFLIWPFACLPWFVHVYWFVKWARSYMKSIRYCKESTK